MAPTENVVQSRATRRVSRVVSRVVPRAVAPYRAITDRGGDGIRESRSANAKTRADHSVLRYARLAREAWLEKW